MDTNKVATGIKVGGAIFMFLCACALGWSLFHPVTSGPTTDQFHDSAHQ